MADLKHGQTLKTQSVALKLIGSNHFFQIVFVVFYTHQIQNSTNTLKRR